MNVLQVCPGCYPLLEGTLMEARASEEALGKCQRKKTPSQTMRGSCFFLEWLRGFLF